MVNTIDKVIDKMIELTGETNWSRFKVRTVENNIVELHKFGKFSAIKNRIESKEIEILYNGKIYNVNDFLNLRKWGDKKDV